VEETTEDHQGGGEILEEEGSPWGGR
jgi:hypothetical protein